MIKAAIAPQTTPVALVTPPPSGTGSQPWRWTREQYYKLGEIGFFQGKRVELIRGEIIEMSPINWRHVVGKTKVANALRGTFAGTGWVNERSPLPMENSEPEPDVAVIPGRIEDYADHPREALLVVEVSDTTLFSDTTTKAELYATANVPEYWVLDLEGKQLHVFRDPIQRPTGPGVITYRTHLTLGPTDSVSPLAAPTTTITVANLLP